MQKFKEIAEEEIIGDIPTSIRNEVPDDIDHTQKSLVPKGDQPIMHYFIVTVCWYSNEPVKIKSIELKGNQEEDYEDLCELKIRSKLFAEKVTARLPSFDSTRSLNSRVDLHAGHHWNWRSIASKIPRITSLIDFSGHSYKTLETRRVGETFLIDDEQLDWLVVDSKLNSFYTNYLTR